MNATRLGYTEYTKDLVAQSLDKYLEWLKSHAYEIVDKHKDIISGLNWSDGSLEKIPVESIALALVKKNIPFVTVWKAVQKAGETLRSGQLITPELVKKFIDYVISNSANRLLDMIGEIDFGFLTNMDMKQFNKNKDEAYADGDFDIIILFECLEMISQSKLKDMLVGKGPERV
jgi:hypothetical protein